jgi:transposase
MSQQKFNKLTQTNKILNKSEVNLTSTSDLKLTQSSIENHIKEKIPSNLNPQYRRRLEIVLRTNMGQSQSEICAAVKCSEDTARYWMLMAQTGKAYERLDLPIGRPKIVNEDYLDRLRELVTCTPEDYGYSFKRWTANWLAKHLNEEFGIEVSDRHINRLLKQMGLSTRDSLPNKCTNNKPWRKGITIDDLF